MRNKIWEKMAFLRNKRNFLLLNVAKREKLDLLSLAGPLKTIQATLKSVIKKNSQNTLSRMVSPNLLHCHTEQPHSLEQPDKVTNASKTF